MMDPTARAQAALNEVERHDGVRVLLAVESGSRAWGFPSADSDYDVRFLYVRPLAAYLSVEAPRDVIERPVDDMLDLSGWDVRKALGLMVRSNAVVLEWLASPVVYRRDPASAAALAGLARRTAHLPALAYHYDRLARSAWSAGDGPVRLKSYFYALRPVLALCWVRRHGTPPPMDLPALLTGTAVPDGLARVVEALRISKALASEAEMAPRVPELDAFLAEALANAAPRPPVWDHSMPLAGADALFRQLVGV